MIIIKAETCGVAWLSYLDAVIKYGKKNMDDGVMIIEADLALLTISSFSQDDEIISTLGDKRLIKRYTKKLFKTDVLPEFTVSYGRRVFQHKGFNLFDQMVKTLKQKPESKSASISLLYPEDQPGFKPCLCLLQTKVRNNRSHLTCCFRSQNAYRSYANFISLNQLHKKVCDDLQLPQGDLTLFVNCPHIYEDDFKCVKSMLLGKSNEIIPAAFI